MFIKIYSMHENDVFEALKNADEGSFVRCGSHDDSCCLVRVNGREYEGFGYYYLDAFSTASSSFEKENKDPIARLPKIEEICTASILEKSYHNSGNSRRRAHLRVFIRSAYAQSEINGGFGYNVQHAREESKSWATHFLALDLMEVDGWHGGWSIQEALWKASKKVRLEVGEVEEGVFYTWYNSIYSCTTNPHTPKEFFEKAFEKSNAIVVHFKQMFEMLTGGIGYDTSFLKTYLGFSKEETPLGVFLTKFGVE